MTTTIYRDDGANAIFVEDNNGAQFLNNLQAVTDNPTDTVFKVRDKSRDNLLLANLAPSDIVDDNGQVYGTDVLSTVNALNALFSASSTPTTQPPSITSALTVNMTEGDTLNYEATATPTAMEWEFSSLPSGVVQRDGNPRVLIGGSNLAVGSYSIPVKAINMNGEDSETITLNVSAPPYSNTKSVNFSNQDYLGPATTVPVSQQVQKIVEPILGRTGNGSGSGDAWSVSLWFKAGNSSNLAQTIFFYGSDDTNNSPYISLKWNGSNANKQRLEFTYGTNFNYLSFLTPNTSLPNDGNWHHVLISYSGGTTGASSAAINQYYSRFKIYIDGSLQTTVNSHANYGYSGAISASRFQLGRTGTIYWSMRSNCRVDEFALWGSDQSGNISNIYNSGYSQDLSLLSASPDHWWRMGDGDTYPNIRDNVGTADFVMYNMTAADIVTDAPPS